MSTQRPTADLKNRPLDRDNIFVDIGDYRSRQVPWVARPQSVEEVLTIVRQANAADPPLRLQPVSTGYNWGLGSRKPVEDGTTLLELSGLAAVREINLQYGYAIIEPGVSQDQLSCALANTAWYCNVTGSAEEASVIGNLLDRGQGYARSRIEDLLGLEVVLPTGELLRTGGFWERAAKVPTHFHYRPGLGPELTGLFAQSNFGVVTAAVISLLPRPETMRLLRCTLHIDRFAAAVDAVQRLYAEGLLNTVGKAMSWDPEAKINKEAAFGESLTKRDFVLYAAYGGRKTVADAVVAESRKILEASSAISDIQFFDVADIASMSPANTFLLRRYLGQIEGARYRDLGRLAAGRMDGESDEGWLFFLPVVPFRGQDAEKAVGLFLQTVAGQSLNGIMTLNFISPKTIDLVTSLCFPRNAESIAGAHQTLGRLHDEFVSQGYLPYRLDIDRTEQYRALSDPTYKEFVHRLGLAIDPHGVMARGRYL